ncbi:hypothetical protein WKK05_10505 [Nostoc sp. UHCC 0302]
MACISLLREQGFSELGCRGDRLRQRNKLTKSLGYRIQAESF